MRRKGAKRFWIAAGSGMGLLAVAWTATGWRGAVSAKNHELDLLRRDGVPLTPADLRRLPIAPEENAAPIYRALIRRMSGNGDLARHFKCLNADEKEVVAGSAPAAELTEVDDALAKGAPIFAMAREASLRPSCDYERPWEKGPGVLLPEYSSIRSLVKAFGMRAIRRADRGDVAGAFDDLRTAARVAHHVGNEPLKIAGWVQIECERTVTEDLWRIAARSPRGAEAGRGAREVVALFGPPFDVRRALGGEVVINRIAMEQIQRDPRSWVRFATGGDADGSGGPMWLSFPMNLPGVVETMTATALHGCRRYYESLPKDPNDVVAVRRASQAADRRLVASAGWQTILAEIFLPTYAEYGNAIVTQAARRRALLAACDRLEGKPMGQIDPFDGKPIRLKPSADGFATYSVGPNGQDEEGRGSDDEDTIEPDDIGFRFPLDPPAPSKWKPAHERSEGHATGWVVR